MPPKMTFLDVLYNLFGIIVLAFYVIAVISVVTRIVVKRRPIGVSLAWLAIIFALPVAGVMTYLIIGEIRLGRKRVMNAQRIYYPYRQWIHALTQRLSVTPSLPTIKAAPLVQLVQQRLGMPLLTNNDVVLIDHPDLFFESLLQSIQQAKSSCFMEFYIWEQTGRVEQIVKELILATERGVDCRLLLDDIGSKVFLQSEICRQLQQKGIQIVAALPAKAWRAFFQRQDLRLHRKLILIDDHIAFTGSMNMVDPQTASQKDMFGDWIDLVAKIQGPSVPVLWSLFAHDWEMETGVCLLDLYHHQAEAFPGGFPVQMIPSGPFIGGNTIQQLLLQALYQAEKSIILTTPYFVPDDPLVSALTTAASRGVSVKIIIPEKNNSWFVSYASDAFLEELIQAGVEIYRFKTGLLHTKSILIDNSLALIGTVNLDRRSLWLNFEVTLLIDSPMFSLQLQKVISSYLLSAHQLDYERWKNRHWWKKVLENIIYLFSPLL